MLKLGWLTDGLHTIFGMTTYERAWRIPKITPQLTKKVITQLIATSYNDHNYWWTSYESQWIIIFVGSWLSSVFVGWIQHISKVLRRLLRRFSRLRLRLRLRFLLRLRLRLRRREPEPERLRLRFVFFFFPGGLVPPGRWLSWFI